MWKHSRSAGNAGLGSARAAGHAGVDRASVVIEAIRPVVTRAINDPELHSALRQAFATGREVNAQLHRKKPAKAARKLAENRKLQARAIASATELRDAVGGIFEQPKKRRRRRGLLILALLAAGAAAVPFLRKRFGGGGGTNGSGDF